jgi:hypothetical protein
MGAKLAFYGQSKPKEPAALHDLTTAKKRSLILHHNAAA